MRSVTAVTVMSLIKLLCGDRDGDEEGFADYGGEAVEGVEEVSGKG